MKEQKIEVGFNLLTLLNVRVCAKLKLCRG